MRIYKKIRKTRCFVFTSTNCYTVPRLVLTATINLTPCFGSFICYRTRQYSFNAFLSRTCISQVHVALIIIINYKTNVNCLVILRYLYELFVFYWPKISSPDAFVFCTLLCIVDARTNVSL